MRFFLEILPFLLATIAIAFLGKLMEHKQWGTSKSKLAQKTPKEIRDIAKRYQQKISGKAGNTWGRIAFFGGFMLAVLYVLLKLNQLVQVPIPGDIRWTLIIGGWAIIALLLLPAFVNFVPKLAAVIVTNFFTGRMHVLAPGLNIRYPWERFSRKIDQLSQRAGEVKKDSTFLSKDGIHVTFKNWVVQWGPFLPLIPLNIRYEVGDKTANATVSDTISEIVESTLFQEVLARTVEFVPNEESLRDPKVVDIIEEELIKALEEGGSKGDKLSSTLEERNGVVIEIAALGPVKFADDYEEALTARRTVAIMREDAKQMATDLGIEGGQALDTVMIANKEGVTRKIFKVEMDQSTREAVSNLGESIKQGVASIAKALPGGSQGSK